MWKHAWITLMEQKFVVLNVILTSATQITIGILAMDMILRRRRSPGCQLIYFSVKVLILDIFIYILLNDYINQNFRLLYCFVLLKIVFAVICILVHRYTYDAGFIKCCLYGLATELGVVLIGAASLIFTGNMDKSLRNMYFSSISWSSLQFIVLSFFIFYIFRFFMCHFFSSQIEME